MKKLFLLSLALLSATPAVIGMDTGTGLGARKRPMSPAPRPATENVIENAAGPSTQAIPLVKAAAEGDLETLKRLLNDPSYANEINVTDFDSRTALVAAAENAREDAVKELLTHPLIKVNIVCPRSKTALTAAIQGGNFKIMEMLVRHPKTRVGLQDYDGITAIMKAATGANHTNFVMLYTLLFRATPEDVNLKDKSGQTALMKAADTGFYDAVKILLEHYADKNLVSKKSKKAVDLARDNLLKALERDRDYVGKESKYIKIILELDPRTRTFEAFVNEYAATGDTGKVEDYLRTKRVDPNYQDLIDKKTALMAAAEKGQEGVVRVLLDSPDIKNRGLNLQDKYKMTALMYAAKTGHAGIVDQLLRYGADVNMQDHGRRTALMHAVEHEDIVIKLLGAEGINLDLRDHLGHTALFHALFRGPKFVNTVKLLVQDPRVDLYAPFGMYAEQSGLSDDQFRQNNPEGMRLLYAARKAREERTTSTSGPVTVTTTGTGSGSAAVTTQEPAAIWRSRPLSPLRQNIPPAS